MIIYNVVLISDWDCKFSLHMPSRYFTIKYTIPKEAKDLYVFRHTANDFLVVLYDKGNGMKEEEGIANEDIKYYSISIWRYACSYKKLWACK